MTERHISVRLSHLFRDCSVGAIVRDPDSHSLMVVQDTRTWTPPGHDPKDRQIRYVDRVRSALGIEKVLCTPPRAIERNGEVTGWIPALRFPTWMRCSITNCGLLHPAPWRSGRQRSLDVSDADEAAPRRPAVHNCKNCGGRLEQVPWVLIHEDGYLADVPWHDLVHRNSQNPNQSQCMREWSKAYLTLRETDQGRQLRCTKCRSTEDFRNEEHVQFPSGTWIQPWVRQFPDPPPEVSAKVVEINDVRVHYPVSRSGLVIPPESRILNGTVTDRLYGNTRDQQKVWNARNPLARKASLKQLASKYRCTVEAIEKALQNINDGYPLYGESITRTDLLVDEFKALKEKIPELKEDEDFVTEHQTDDWRQLESTLSNDFARRVSRAVSTLVSVNRLKEVLVLCGFQREGGDKIVPPDVIDEADWLPALEMYGEGIFFTLNEAMLQSWQSCDAIRARADDFSKRYQLRTGQSTAGREINVSPRFLLCHTLAHLVIRELDAGSGYPAASLKERIYCATGDEPMAGILIYVAVPDEEGSLGGLMELAKPHRFLRILIRAFESAARCSLDPVCCEQDGHGPDLLNRAACHACALVPEPSCEFGNALLDRIFVTGAKQDVPGFLDFAESAS